MTLKAGDLRHLVTIEERATVQDEETGAISVQWQEFEQRWAKVEPLSAREFVNSQALQSKVTTRITMRRLDGLRANMRIVWRDQVYDIHGILPDPVSGLEYVTIPCSVGVNEG